MSEMSTQTVLNILLSATTVYLGIRNFILTSKKESQRESEEMTAIRVQLDQVMGMLRDLQKDVRTSTADFRAMSERVAVIETKLQTAFKRIDELKAKNETR